MECVFFYFQMVNLWFQEWIFSLFLTIYFFLVLFGLFYPFSLWTLKPLFYPDLSIRPFSTYLVFSTPFLLILTFKSRIYLEFHFWPQSCRCLIVTTSFTCPSFVCNPYQNNAPQISQIQTLIYLGLVLNALPIKKCDSKFQKYRQRFILEQFCMHSLSKNTPQI